MEPTINLKKLISVIIIFFIKSTYQIITFIYKKIDDFQSYFIAIFTLLINLGEEKFINKCSQNLVNVPRHIGIILMKEPFFIILSNLLKITYWSLLLKIKYLTIYDPFNTINQIHIVNSFKKVFINYRIAVNIKGKTIDTQKDKIYDVFPENNYDIVISIIDFCESNHGILSNINTNIDKQNIIFPKSLEFLKPLYIKDKDNKSPISFIEIRDKMRSLFTRKEKEYLPELILFAGNEEICLYGFPFTLIENSEIMNIGKISQLDVTRFINIFMGYNKTNKRYGK